MGLCWKRLVVWRSCEKLPPFLRILPWMDFLEGGIKCLVLSLNQKQIFCSDHPFCHVKNWAHKSQEPHYMNYNWYPKWFCKLSFEFFQDHLTVWLLNQSATPHPHTQWLVWQSFCTQLKSSSWSKPNFLTDLSMNNLWLAFWIMLSTWEAHLRSHCNQRPKTLALLT